VVAIVIRLLATTPVVPSPGTGKGFYSLPRVRIGSGGQPVSYSKRFGSALGASRSPTPSVSDRLWGPAGLLLQAFRDSFPRG